MDYNCFSQLYYLQNSKTFFQNVILAIELANKASCCQKGIQKLNTIIIAQFTIKKEPNIVNDLCRHYTTMD